MRSMQRALNKQTHGPLNEGERERDNLCVACVWHSLFFRSFRLFFTYILFFSLVFPVVFLSQMPFRSKYSFFVFNGLHSKPNISLDAYRSFTRNPQIASVHRHWHCVKIVLHFNLLQLFFVCFISSTLNPSNAYTNVENIKINAHFLFHWSIKLSWREKKNWYKNTNVLAGTNMSLVFDKITSPTTWIDNGGERENERAREPMQKR